MACGPRRCPAPPLERGCAGEWGWGGRGRPPAPAWGGRPRGGRKRRRCGGVAERVGRPRAARAVGRVMATNPLPLVVPCHRVIGSDGGLTRYGGGVGMEEGPV